MCWLRLSASYSHGAHPLSSLHALWKLDELREGASAAASAPRSAHPGRISTPLPPRGAKTSLPCRLPAMAALAKRLQVVQLVRPSLRHRDDVVDLRGLREPPLRPAHPAPRLAPQNHLAQAPPPLLGIHPVITAAVLLLAAIAFLRVFFAVLIKRDSRTAGIKTRSRKYASHDITTLTARTYVKEKPAAKWRPPLSQRHSRGRPRNSNLS